MSDQEFKGNQRIANWIEDKFANEDWKKDNQFFAERMRTLCYRLFVENPEGAEWLRMLEYQYMTNPYKNVSVNHDNMLIEEGIKIVIRSCIENALAHIEGVEDKPKTYVKNVRRGRR